MRPDTNRFKEYMKRVKIQLEELVKEYGDPDMIVDDDPMSGTCYVISKDNWEKNVSAGTVSHVKVDHAARLIVDGTHEIATNAQIKQHLAFQHENLRQSRAKESERGQKFVIAQPVPVVQQSATKD